jgi:hypothetical protein
MPRSTPRRLMMADLAILTAGVALSMGLLKKAWATLADFREWPGSHVWGLHESQVLTSVFLGIASALVAARSVQPRPRWRSVFRQPGTMACLAILGHMLIVIISFSWNLTRSSIFGSSRLLPEFNRVLHANRSCGGWVAAVWLTLALSHAWRPEPSWIDRSGRVLGVAAIFHWLWSLLI